MISRATITWFLLLAGFTAALAFSIYEEEAPCREWRKTHPSTSHRQAPVLDRYPVLLDVQETGETFSLSPCDMWSEQPLEDKLFAVGWLISLVGFLRSLSQDLWRWFRRPKTPEAAHP
jgi:hypothetical protein